MSVVNQKLIARNTLLLYIRMALIMVVSLYTARVILDALGETDYGIYSTVAGIVMMFAFLSNTMSAACQRFYADEMGRGDREGVRNIFSLCVVVFAVIAVIVVVLCETLGLWLLRQKIQTEGRMDAARWVFQCAILSFVFTILRMPYQGIIIIKEKMKVFTYISVFEALGNLVIALCIAHTSSDRLILYGVLMMVINALVSTCYFVYCIRYYSECRLCIYWNRHKFSEIFHFAGWNMIGSLASICKSQGLTVLLNMFFGNALVAARGMAYKVFSTLQQFADSFFNAVRPQIMKSYAAGERENMVNLVFQSSKFSYYLMFFLALPLFLETPVILNVWLKDVPDSTILFTRLMIINALIDVLTSPLATSVMAYGKIRNYQLICGGFLLLILPVSYILLKCGLPAYSIFVVSIVISALAIGVRVLLVHKYIGISVRRYFSQVLLPIIIVSITASIIPFALKQTLSHPTVNFFVVCFTAVLMTSLSILFLGVTRSERKHILSVVMNKICKT